MDSHMKRSSIPLGKCILKPLWNTNYINTRIALKKKKLATPNVGRCRETENLMLVGTWNGIIT